MVLTRYLLQSIIIINICIYNIKCMYLGNFFLVYLFESHLSLFVTLMLGARIEVGQVRIGSAVRYEGGYLSRQSTAWSAIAIARNGPTRGARRCSRVFLSTTTSVLWTCTRWCGRCRRSVEMDGIYINIPRLNFN